MFDDNQVFVFTDYESTGVTTYEIALGSTVVKPIEIGMIFTDREFNKIDEYSSYIMWSDFSACRDWEEYFETIHPSQEYLIEEFRRAYTIHKIPLKRIKEKGKFSNYIVHDINNIMVSHEMFKMDRKPLIISDSPNFELYMTEIVFGARTNDGFPFHYNAWCINPTLQLLDIKTKYKPHNALDDAAIMHEGMKLAYSRIEELKEIEYYYEDLKR